MWFKKKKTPKTTIDKLKASYEKVDFNNVKELIAKLKYFKDVMSSFNKSKIKLDDKIKTIAKKSEQHQKNRVDLKEIESKSAIELNELKGKEESVEIRSRIRKITAALHNAQFKLSNFDRESRDYINTEKVLSSLYIDLEDCRNILEYMISSLDRNLERVRAADFFTVCPEEPLKEDSTYYGRYYSSAGRYETEPIRPAPSRVYTYEETHNAYPTISGTPVYVPTTKIRKY